MNRCQLAEVDGGKRALFVSLEQAGRGEGEQSQSMVLPADELWRGSWRDASPVHRLVYEASVCVRRRRTILSEAAELIRVSMAINGCESMKRRRLFMALLMLLCLALPARAQEPDSTNEFWPEFDIFIKLNERSRIFVLYAGTKQENLGAFADGQTGVHFDFYAVSAFRPVITSIDQSRSKFLMVRVGYLVSRPKNNSGTSTEHMATTEGTTRAQLPGGLLLSDRNRFDFRWVESDARHRYRNRLKLERTFAIGRFQFTPYGHAELFYDLKPRDWSRLRYAAGAEFSITKRIVLEGYYLRQNTWASVPQFVNAAGTAVQFYFR
jgi:hypothetical protein